MEEFVILAAVSVETVAMVIKNGIFMISTVQEITKRIVIGKKALHHISFLINCWIGLFRNARNVNIIKNQIPSIRENSRREIVRKKMKYVVEVGDFLSKKYNAKALHNNILAMFSLSVNFANHPIEKDVSKIVINIRVYL